MYLTSDPQAAFANDLGNETSVDDIRDAFGFFTSWEDKYQYIIDFGKQLAPMPDEDKNDEHILHGCQSVVWISFAQNPDDGNIYILVDSDAAIVRGLAAIVLTALNGKSPAEILAFEIQGYFDELALIKHLSVTRGNGLIAMVNKIREFALSATA